MYRSGVLRDSIGGKEGKNERWKRGRRGRSNGTEDKAMPKIDRIIHRMKQRPFDE